jgi:hypothetical protein
VFRLLQLESCRLRAVPATGAFHSASEVKKSRQCPVVAQLCKLLYRRFLTGERVETLKEQ